MNLSLNGTITEILTPESGTSKSTGNEWIKQTFVIDTGDEYNPLVAFSVFGQEKVDNLKNFKAGQAVEVNFNINSREYNGKYYTNVDAWKIKALDEAGQTEEEAEISDDLPF